MKKILDIFLLVIGFFIKGITVFVLATGLWYGYTTGEFLEMAGIILLAMFAVTPFAVVTVIFYYKRKNHGETVTKIDTILVRTLMFLLGAFVVWIVLAKFTPFFETTITKHREQMKTKYLR